MPETSALPCGGIIRIRFQGFFSPGHESDQDPQRTYDTNPSPATLQSRQQQGYLTLDAFKAILLTSQLLIFPSFHPPMSIQTTASEPRWQRRKDARPAELLAAALEIFTERGFAGTRLDAVAARAGVSKGTLYLYYANKEDLFKAVVRAGLVSPLTQARDMIDSFNGTSAELLRHFVRGWWERIGATALSGIPKLMLAEAANFPEIGRFYIEEVVLPGQATMTRIIERGIARGEFRAVDPAQVAHLLAAPFLLISAWRHGFAHAVCDSLPSLLDAPALLEAHIDILTRGLASEAAQASAIRPAGKTA